ncbi:MAG: hypothetical protein A2Z21_07545 [Candidatus Fraserbacteria bacterium RBG_16_55_9]|uniref:Uncharacterized protein n=1 Tax=Fraserbacteria sp. (strain RBG_16_55_9) TaxID=1817864 RepID=A0A1F5UQW9_FRAXR|nr:MAG: hypothetical protein A2Z21_07545 [Candidatus Fraserbacteria bacterium RBG_16_55_9]
MRKATCLLFVFGALGLSGCDLLDSLSPDFTPSPVLFEDLSMSELHCIVFPEGVDSHIIRNPIEYAALFNPPQSFLGTPECKNLTRQPPVDLSKYTILGQLVQGGGCSARFQKIVNRNDVERFIRFVVVMQSFGLCEMLISNRNWIAIPSIPRTYEVGFAAEHRQWAATTPIPELELQLEYEPTFAPRRWTVEFGRVPPFSLYKDGTAIYLKTVPNSSEQHVRTVKLSESERQALLKRVEELGFDRLASREPRPGEPIIADAPYIVLRMERGAALKEVRVYFNYVSDAQAWQAILDLFESYDHPRAEEYRAQQATLFVRKLSDEEEAQYDNVRVKSWPYGQKYLKPHKPDQYEWAWVFSGNELQQFWQDNGTLYPQLLIYGGSGGLYEIEVVPWLPDDSFPIDVIESYPGF